MSSGSGKRKKGKGDLNSEDRALWQAFSKSVKPLSRQKRIAKTVEEPAPSGDSRETKHRTEHNNAPVEKSPAVPAAKRPEPSSQPKVTPNLNQFDDKKIRRLNSGRQKVEARLDLHGKRQNEAFAALRQFLHMAASKDYRTVLIITGKGLAQGDGQQDWMNVPERDRGVLRRMLPNWLEQPEFRAFVVGYTRAGPRHGGDGAFYVQLRSARRRK